MLGLILPVCKEFGEKKILLTCDKDNEGSSKTIIKNGGVLEKEIIDDIGLGKSGIIERYWIMFLLLFCTHVAHVSIWKTWRWHKY